jgi:hypothetical protein
MLGIGGERPQAGIIGARQRFHVPEEERREHIRGANRESFPGRWKGLKDAAAIHTAVRIAAVIQGATVALAAGHWWLAGGLPRQLALCCDRPEVQAGEKFTQGVRIQSGGTAL